ncbi:Pigment-dispersing factor receptor [Carabus blaptoides fortunei]
MVHVQFCVFIIFISVLPTSLGEVPVLPCRDIYLPGENEDKFCLYRNTFYPRDLFLYATGLGCFTYGSKGRFVEIPKLNKCYVKKHTYYLISYTPIDNSTFFYYDYRNATAVAAIGKYFINNEYLNKWMDCARAAMECCDNQMTNDSITAPNGEYCPAVWDAWTCYPKTTPNSISEQTCPYYIFFSDPPCTKNSEKECFADGKWNDTTNYNTCNDINTVMISRYEFQVIILSVSIAICLPAIIIFYCYQSLRMTKNILHRNLLIAITVKNIFVIMSKELVVLPIQRNDSSISILLENSVACRTLAFFERAAINAMFACMLVDGFYLHKMIVAVFRKEPPILWLYGAVGVLTLGPTLIWAIFKALYNNFDCWIRDELGHQWILDGSRYLMLGVNVILLLDIIRVLVWKLKRNNGTQHAKTTIRATLILLPLFGIQFIMVSQRPVNATCYWDNVFYFASYTIDSFQGIVVSLFYCYLNKEVQGLLRKTYQSVKREIMYKYENTRRTTENVRRTTAATYVTEQEPRRVTLKLDSIVEEPNVQKTNVHQWLRNNFTSRPQITSMESTNC